MRCSCWWTIYCFDEREEEEGREGGREGRGLGIHRGEMDSKGMEEG